MGRRKKTIEYLISIDGSTTNTGIAIFNIDTEELVNYSHIKPENDKKFDKKTNMDNRIKMMIKDITTILNKYNPRDIAMEDTYGAKDMYAYKKLCHLQGLLLSYSITNNISMEFYTPLFWRKKIGIPITKDKKRLKRNDFKTLAVEIVREKYNIDVTEDEAEAICIGLARIKELKGE